MVNLLGDSGRCLGFIQAPFIKEGNLEDRTLTIADTGAFDPENPKSLLNLVPKGIKETFLRTKNSFLNNQSTESIRSNIKHTKEYKVVRLLRQSFWQEYNTALQSNRRMEMTRVWQGITFNSTEFYNLMKEDHFAAFIFTKPIRQDTQERDLLEIAYEQIESILSASHFNKDDSLNAQAARVKFEVWKHLDERVNGGVIKQVATKIEQKSVNYNINQDTPKLEELQRAEDLAKRLEDLREQTKDIEAVSHVIEYDESDDE